VPLTQNMQITERANNYSQLMTAQNKAHAIISPPLKRAVGFNDTCTLFAHSHFLLGHRVKVIFQLGVFRHLVVAVALQ
jgi:hypothetical protein